MISIYNLSIDKQREFPFILASFAFTKMCMDLLRLEVLNEFIERNHDLMKSVSIILLITKDEYIVLGLI